MTVVTRSELEDLLGFEGAQRRALVARVEALEVRLRDRAGNGFVDAWVGEEYRAADRQLVRRRLLAGAEVAAAWLTERRAAHTANDCDAPLYVARVVSLVAVRVDEEMLWGDPWALVEG